MDKSAERSKNESLFDVLLRFLGRRADDPELISFVTDTLHAKPLVSIKEEPEFITAKELGVELSFSFTVRNRKYPTIKATKNSYTPYLTTVILSEKFPDPLPFGLKLGAPGEQLDQILGERWLPEDWGPLQAGQQAGNWDRVLDQTRDLVIHWHRNPKGKEQISLRIMQAKALGDGMSRHIVGVFVSWAIMQDLIDESSLVDRLELVEQIRRRERCGAELFEPDDFWDIHLKKEPGLREFAHSYFHNLAREKKYIVYDFIKVFGGRKGPYGHDEPVLDDDSWSQVDRATAILDQSFARWTGVEVVSIEEFVRGQLRSGQAIKDIASDCALKFSIPKSEAFKLALALKSKDAIH